MKISLNEIKKLVPEAAKVPEQDLITLIGSRLVEVEQKIDLRPKYANIFIVKVVECEPIEGTHLHRCQIINGAEEGLVGDSGPYKLGQTAASVGPEPPTNPSSVPSVQVVCGAPNVHKGMLAVWLAPGAIIPQTFGEENIKLSVRKLQGHESNGMLAGLDELDLGDDHSGIVEIDPKMAKPGDSFAEVFDLNDTILDIENKSLTHRPDAFGLIGFAREVAGILGVKFTMSDSDLSNLPVKTSPSTPTIIVEDSALCPRYTCAVVNLKDPLAKEKYLTKDAVFLAKSGMHTISKIVDITNIMMLKTAQPLHAFDYNKFLSVGGSKDPKIIIRPAKNSEELQLLDGKTITCTENDIIITSNNVPVALAGAMGGKNTEIDESTTTVLLESATFSLYNLRKTQMSHGIFSEAITRFTKGQPADQTLPVLAEAVAELGGELIATADAYPGKTPQPTIPVKITEINALLGTRFNTPTIVKTLENVNIKVEVKDEEILVTPPYWRTDLHLKEDVIEEIGRLLGYDNIEKTLPLRPFKVAEIDQILKFKTNLRNILSDQLGANELLTYSFVSKSLQQKVGEDPENSYEITNSISPELEAFRQTITPSLLEKARQNQKAGFTDFAIYEFNQVTSKSIGLTAEGTPKLHHHLALVATGDYYQAKAYLVRLLEILSIPVEIAPYNNTLPYLEPRHSATINHTISLGEIRPSILRALKLSNPISAFELDLEELLSSIPATTARIKTFSKFPPTARDLTFRVPAATEFENLETIITKVLEREPDLLFTLTPTSIYQSEKDTSTKNLSFHLELTSTRTTLTSETAAALVQKIATSAQKLNAIII